MILNNILFHTFVFVKPLQMSFQTFVTQRLAAITAQMNALSQNAKRIFELPAQTNLVPTSKIHVDNSGVSQSLTLQQIVDFASGQPQLENIFISFPNPAFTLDAGAMTITMHPHIKWRINTLIFENVVDVILNIDPAADGYMRKDIVVANALNNFQIIKGSESTTVAIEPDLPPNTLRLTGYDVNGAVVGNPENPSLGSNYVEKVYFGEVEVSGSGTNFMIDLDANGRNTYNFTTAPVNFKGFNYDLGYQHLFIGKIFFIKNGSSTAFNILKNTIAVPNQILFGFAYTIQPDELIMVRISSNGLLEFITTSLTFSIGQKQDKMSVIEISTNTTLSNLHHGKVLLIIGNVTLTIPATGLADDFTCDIDVLSGFTCAFFFSATTTVSGNSGLSLLGNKMATLYKRGNTNNYRLKGELS